MAHTSVRRTQELIDSREFQEWQEYYKQEPFGDDWDQAAMVAATNINLWAKRKIDPKRLIPRFDGTPAKSPEQMEAELMRFARAYNRRLEAKEQRAKGK